MKIEGTQGEIQLPPSTTLIILEVIEEKQLMPRGGWRGGGRKPKPESEKYIKFQISCPPQLKEKLDSYLQTQTLDRSTYISKLIELDLAKVKSKIEE